MNLEYESEYVATIRTAADRVRWALYAVFSVCAFMAINHYNVQSWSWPWRRLATWYEIGRTGKPSGLVPFGDIELLKIAREEYLRQFVSHNVIASSSSLSLGIDVNDTGTVGGFLLMLTMLILLISLTREREILQLALRRITAFSRAHIKDSDAIAKANEFYHILAMTQTLSSPPTSVNWSDRGVWHHLYMVFFAPLAVYAWVFLDDWQSYRAASIYGVSLMPLMILQTAMFTLIAIIAAGCLYNVTTMAGFWRRTFFRLNPRLRRRIVH